MLRGQPAWLTCAVRGGFTSRHFDTSTDCGILAYAARCLLKRRVPPLPFCCLRSLAPSLSAFPAAVFCSGMLGQASACSHPHLSLFAMASACSGETRRWDKPTSGHFAAGGARHGAAHFSRTRQPHCCVWRCWLPPHHGSSFIAALFRHGVYSVIRHAGALSGAEANVKRGRLYLK